MTKKYAKIVNEETKQCEVGLGTNEDFYKSLGMKKLDVEESFDGSWYLVGYAPKQDIKVLQEQKLLENNEKCSNYILSVYPYYKQMNIINPLSDYSIEDRTAMNEFIDSQRAKNKEYKKQILDEKIKSKEDLDEIIIKYGKNN